jgi:hypothetical protein
MCVGTGGRDFGGSGVPGRGADVHRVVSSHCLRLLLFKTVKGGSQMKIVVWKAPRFLRGFLLRFWGKDT